MQRTSLLRRSCMRNHSFERQAQPVDLRLQQDIHVGVSLCLLQVNVESDRCNTR